MSNNANQLTNEQALQILFDVTELDQLKLNAKDRRTVNFAVQTLDKLVCAAAAQAKAFTPDVATENQTGGIVANTVNIN